MPYHQDANIVYIYSGAGTASDYFDHFASTFNHCLNPRYRIEYIFSDQVINEPWEKKAALFIIPGGADIPYMKALNGAGNKKITSYVENGGAFLGICAGSYYAGAFVDFAKETSIEVQGPRELSFFPGIVRGPDLAPYDYKSMSGARAAAIAWTTPFQSNHNAPCMLFYNGGGYFVDAANAERTRVLATYCHTDEHAAIIECRVGSGTALLSAVHFEYDPHLALSHSFSMQTILQMLQETNTQRLQKVKQLLNRLHIECAD